MCANESGSMTKVLFGEWCEYFVSQMDKAGYGRKYPGHNMILLLDGHSSRWTYHGLLFLIKAGFFPFCIASHTSAWDQPNDNGPNAMFKALMGKIIHEWRVAHPFSVFDRTVYNKCLAKAILRMQIKLAADLASWTAKKTAWIAAGAACGDFPIPPLVGKPGNVVTRAWERTGW